MVRYYKPSTILELGTSLGITTSYLAKGNSEGRVITMEGASAIAATAKQNFQSLNLANIEVVEGNFDETLSSALQNLKVDLAYIDGNHRYLPTIEYFHQILQHSHNTTIIILDDIHWSKEMEQAWDWVKTHQQVTLTIDLFAIGIVVLRKEILHKQHFSVRY
jgi:predicted O-methyltransferase YrrM